MAALASQHQHLFYAPANPQLVVVTRRKCPPTTRVECLLLLLTIVLFAFEEQLPGIGGFSVTFFLFIISGIYVVIQRFGSLVRVWTHRIFLVSYALIFISVLLEAYSPSPRYSEIIRIAQMFVGAVVLATLCRDVKALKTCLFGYILVGILTSLYLFLSSYGALQGATAVTFDEASQLRNEVFQDEKMNLNSLASFIAPAVGAALALALMSPSALVRYSLFGIMTMCFIASFLPLSRGGIGMTLIACMAVTLAYGRANRVASSQRFIRIIVLLLGLGMCMLLWVPQAVFSRLSFHATPAKSYEDGSEARVKVYRAALVHLPEYWLTGVGAGNFWGSWGKRSQYQILSSGSVLGPHNCFIQITIYWGLAGLLLLLSIVYYAYKCLPEKCGNNALSLAVLGITASLFVHMWVSHGLYFKGFSLGLGILIGMQCWIWPEGEPQVLGRVIRKTLTEGGTAS